MPITLDRKTLSYLSRRSLMACALLAFLAFASGGQQAAASDDPAIAYVRGLGEDVIAILNDKANSTLAEREAAFRGVIARGFDIPTVSRFVLGRHWKSATKEQRAEFSALFVDFIARVYASRFDSLFIRRRAVHGAGRHRRRERRHDRALAGRPALRRRSRRARFSACARMTGITRSSISMSKASACCSRTGPSSAR